MCLFDFLYSLMIAAVFIVVYVVMVANGLEWVLLIITCVVIGFLP